MVGACAAQFSVQCCHVALVLGRRHLIKHPAFLTIVCPFLLFIYIFHLVSITYTHTGDPVSVVDRTLKSSY